MTDVAFSRSGASNPFGKCDQVLKTEVPEQVKNDFTGVSFVERISGGELLRNMVMDNLYGCVSPEMQKIAWEHVQKETDSEFIRGAMQKIIFGNVHVASLEIEARKTSAAIGTHYKQGAGDVS